MKKLIFNALKVLSVCAMLGVLILSAQIRHTIIANVPFDFTALDQHLSAGTYTFTSDSPQGTILIHGEQGGAAAFVLGLPVQANKIQEDAKLVFHRYGDQYFLSKIWYPWTDQGRELRVSKVEEQIARNMPKPEETTLLVAGSKQQKPVR
ncbi:MAG TPA: hypothetical protein VH601_24215 [Bryobacteraceae bacterium]|jgi:hypothetical protein